MRDIEAKERIKKPKNNKPKERKRRHSAP